MATGPTTPIRIIDLNQSSEKHDAHLIRQLLFQLLADMQTIAEKLNAETGLTNKTYLQGIISKYR